MSQCLCFSDKNAIFFWRLQNYKMTKSSRIKKVIILIMFRNSMKWPKITQFMIQIILSRKEISDPLFLSTERNTIHTRWRTKPKNDKNKAVQRKSQTHNAWRLFQIEIKCGNMNNGVIPKELSDIIWAKRTSYMDQTGNTHWKNYIILLKCVRIRAKSARLKCKMML